ncbi:MAG: gliding motility-associated C-terminal domain-containing protein [Bacteroidetes bacterium]|nr:gliding motility-associated C-terminal domain-containing protein [Bacteroidota bacterium]
MKRVLFFILLLSGLYAKAQVFWTETFGTGCNQLQMANGLNPGSNGTWTVVSTGTNDADANEWYISATENGNAVGACGSGCGTNRTLHVASIPNGSGFSLCPSGDCGAAYDAGGFITNTTTNKRVESPVINCTGKSSITISFKYMEEGQGTNDDASLLYFDGSTWTTIDPIAKSVNTSCSGQGKWTAFSLALPASANNNANVKIGFNWTNDSDGSGSDPSFAVDDIALSTATVAAPPVADFAASSTTICAGQCINFTDNSTNTPTSWSWSFPGASVTTATLQNPTNICYNTAGTYTVSLTATNTSGSNTATKSNYITVLPTPTVNTTPHFGAICGGIPVNVSATGAANYTWTPAAGLSSTNTASATCAATANTIYTVTGTAANGCSDTAIVSITVGGMNLLASVSPTVICSGDSTALLASGASSYTWQPGSSLSNSFVANPAAAPASTTVYTVTGTSGSCSGTQTVQVLVNPTPSAAFTYTVSGNTPPVTVTFINNSTGAVQYLWTFSDGSPSFTSTATNPVQVFNSGTHTMTLVATSAAGCAASASGIYIISDSSYIIMPNVFTPNEDSINEVFKPMLSGIKSLICTIYDRWGIKIYEFTRPHGFWDGRTTSGEACVEGVYFYVLEATGYDDKSYKLKGHLTLIR